LIRNDQQYFYYNDKAYQLEESHIADISIIMHDLSNPMLYDTVVKDRIPTLQILKKYLDKITTQIEIDMIKAIKPEITKTSILQVFNYLYNKALTNVSSKKQIFQEERCYLLTYFVHNKNIKEVSGIKEISLAIEKITHKWSAHICDILTSLNSCKIKQVIMGKERTNNPHLAILAKIADTIQLSAAYSKPLLSTVRYDCMHTVKPPLEKSY